MFVRYKTIFWVRLSGFGEVKVYTVCLNSGKKPLWQTQMRQNLEEHVRKTKFEPEDKERKGKNKTFKPSKQCWLYLSKLQKGAI